MGGEPAAKRVELARAPPLRSQPEHGSANEFINGGLGVYPARSNHSSGTTLKFFRGKKRKREKKRKKKRGGRSRGKET